MSQSELNDRTNLETVQLGGLSRLEFHCGRRAYQVNGEKHRYDFFFDAKDVRLPLIVFGQGAQDRGQVQLPRFQRMDWSRALPYNVMIFNDPTLFCSDDLTLGWCAGTADYPVLPTHVEIVMAAAKFLWIEPRNILFYGSSAGGFTSLMLSSMIQGSSALVNNPQTDIFRFKRGGVKRLLEVAFPSYSPRDLNTIARDRFSFVERVRMGDHLPNIYYLQNLLDDDHVVDQMNPLLSALQGRLRG